MENFWFIILDSLEDIFSHTIRRVISLSMIWTDSQLRTPFVIWRFDSCVFKEPCYLKHVIRFAQKFTRLKRLCKRLDSVWDENSWNIGLTGNLLKIAESRLLHPSVLGRARPLETIYQQYRQNPLILADSAKGTFSAKRSVKVDVLMIG